MNPYLLGGEEAPHSVFALSPFTSWNYNQLNLPQLLSVWVSSAARIQHYAEFTNLAQIYVFFLQI